MLPTGHLAAFALLSFALIVIPGPNVLFVVSRSLQLAAPLRFAAASSRRRTDRGSDRPAGGAPLA
jgi:threonine/homoserine/homoserine lactone efflux protein